MMSKLQSVGWSLHERRVIDKKWEDAMFGYNVQRWDISTRMEVGAGGALSAEAATIQQENTLYI